MTTVKEWKPEQGCKACERAQQILREHQRISGSTHAKAMSKIRHLSSLVKSAFIEGYVNGAVSQYPVFNPIEKSIESRWEYSEAAKQLKTGN